MRSVAFCLSLCLLICLQAVAQDRSTPEATVRTFLSAFASGEMKQASTCVKGAQIGGGALETIAEQMRKNPVTCAITDVKTQLKDTSATVTGKVSMRHGKSEKDQVFPTEVNLILSKGAWLIVPDPAKSQNANSPDVVNSLAYVLTNLKVMTGARESARATSCLSNIRQLCLGALMLAQDYDEKFKIRPETVKKSIMPYIKNDAVFKCPADSGSATSYTFNGNLSGVSMAKIQALAETVLLYEGKNGKLDFRHNGKAAVGFADGHAKLIDAEAAKKLRWKP